MKIKETATDYQLIKIENQILTNPLLKFEQYLPKDKSLVDIVYDIILNNRTSLTINTKTNLIQCEKDKNRSITDLFLLMRYYYPETTLKEFRQCLFDLVNDRKIGTLFCGSISKRVFYHPPNKYCPLPDNIHHIDYKDEYGLHLGWLCT